MQVRVAASGQSFNALIERATEKLRKSGLRHNGLSGLRLSSDGTTILDDASLHRVLSTQNGKVATAVAIFSDSIASGGIEEAFGSEQPPQSTMQEEVVIAEKSPKPSNHAKPVGGDAILDNSGLDFLSMIKTSSDGIHFEPTTMNEVVGGGISPNKEPKSQTQSPSYGSADSRNRKTKMPEIKRINTESKGMQVKVTTGKQEAEISEDTATDPPESSPEHEGLKTSQDIDIMGTEAGEKPTHKQWAQWWSEMSSSGWKWSNKGGVGFGRYIAPDKTEFIDHPDQRPYAAMVRFHLKLPVAEEELNLLMEMGYPRDQCHHALQLFTGNIEVCCG